MTGPDPAAAFALSNDALGDRFRLDRLVAASEERVLFEAFDRTLKRRVSLRVNLTSDQPGRGWFMRESEAMGQLDHSAIRHVYEAGVVRDVAYRVGNWFDGEGLQEAIGRSSQIQAASQRSWQIGNQRLQRQIGTLGG